MRSSSLKRLRMLRADRRLGQAFPIVVLVALMTFLVLNGFGMLRGFPGDVDGGANAPVFSIHPNGAAPVVTSQHPPPGNVEDVRATYKRMDQLDPLDPHPGESFVRFEAYIGCLAARLRVDVDQKVELPIFDAEAFFPYLVTPLTFEVGELKAFLCNMTVPIKHLHIVQNWRLGSMTEFLDVTARMFDFTKRLRIDRYPRNRGYAGALNLAMRHAMQLPFEEVPFFFMSNTDVRFAPGLLEEALPRIHAGSLGGRALLEQFKNEVATEPNAYTPPHFRAVPLRSTDDKHLLVTSPSLPDRVRYMDEEDRAEVFRGVDGYYYLDADRQTATWGLSRLAMETTGFFDENCFPAYHEDTDYLLRLKILGLQAVHGAPQRRGVVHLVNNFMKTTKADARSAELGDLFRFLRGTFELLRFMLPAQYIAAKPRMVNISPEGVVPVAIDQRLPPDAWVLDERRRRSLNEMMELSIAHFSQPRQQWNRDGQPLINFVPSPQRMELLRALSPILSASVYLDDGKLCRVSADVW